MLLIPTLCIIKCSSAVSVWTINYTVKLHDANCVPDKIIVIDMACYSIIWLHNYYFGFHPFEWLRKITLFTEEFKKIWIENKINVNSNFVWIQIEWIFLNPFNLNILSIHIFWRAAFLIRKLWNPSKNCYNVFEYHFFFFFYQCSANSQMDNEVTVSSCFSIYTLVYGMIDLWCAFDLFF